ncbi:hypothetical protein RxyAA322_21700 [Rubrobacter xylanophilus]|uniref:Oxygen sensor histidine kinase NreB n=1 Tax=Rubrobacter xylanophilus TaxID=49319 RepID=A0A510HJW5_9ACTN|nr:sensor histidine kinase [Rubrobacter xylanophilus]BBL80316.1 hypothetical protein RxyAA322_21700 [Rubrobacter xylanophilus]
MLAAGVCAGLLSYVLSVFLISLYATTGAIAGALGVVGGMGAGRFGLLVADYGMPLLFLALVVPAALLVGRRTGVAGPLHGVMTGLAAAATHQAVGLLFGPPDVYELLIYPSLGLGGGLLGGARGWAVRSGEQAFRDTNRALAAARSARQVAAALGENLAGSGVVGLCLWARPGDGPVRLLSEWTPAGSSPTGGPLPDPSSWTAGWPRRPLRIPVSSLSPGERSILESRGVGSVLAVPLLSPGGGFRGLMTVFSRGRRGFSRSDLRAYAAAAGTAALVLENLRLVERARRAGVLEERQRLAHEIHDTLAQGFTSIVTNLEAAGGALERDRVALRHHLDQALGVARESLSEARRLVWALRPEPLEEASLPEALRRLVARWSSSSGVAAEVFVTGEPGSLPAEAEVALLRVAQEALANVRKHARAGRVAVTLSYIGGRAVLDVRDDGVGFDPAATSPGSGGDGFGLRSMRERLERAGGALSVESVPGEGTVLSAEVPNRAAEPVGKVR